jgi:hypothetical protein
LQVPITRKTTAAEPEGRRLEGIANGQRASG